MTPEGRLARPRSTFRASTKGELHPQRPANGNSMVLSTRQTYLGRDDASEQGYQGMLSQQAAACACGGDALNGLQVAPMAASHLQQCTRIPLRKGKEV